VVQRSPLALIADLSGNPGASLRALRELFEDARRFVTQQAAWERGQSREFSVSRVDLNALRPILEREIPLVVSASDLEALIRFAAEEKIRLVIRGAAEGHLVADQLAKAGVGVLIDPLVYGPGGFDQLYGRRDNAALLQRAGVTVAIGTFSAHNLRKLRQLAGNAVREGLPWEAGLDAITTAPARLFGIPGYGTLTASSVANVAVWGGDPLELSTQLEQLYIHGRRIELKSRQTELFQRYRTVGAIPRPALSLP
jgi:imidazolonepropionase-like amidohydrolase